MRTFLIVAVLAFLFAGVFLPASPGSFQDKIQASIFECAFDAARFVASLAGKLILPKLDGVEYVQGIHESVKIVRDEWGVPHIYANSPKDVVFGQGFTHAQDRLMQLDILRRSACGRLSEIIGEKTLFTDKLLRSFQICKTAQKLTENVKQESPETYYSVYVPYVQGINAYIQSEQFQKPIELHLLKIQSVELFSVEDTIAITILISWQMSRGWGTELSRAALIAALGKEKFADIDSFHTVDPIKPAIPDGMDLEAISDLFKENLLSKARNASVEDIPSVDGSNAWAVRGTKTKSGKVLLASDPHLKISTPSIWYLNHLKSNDKFLDETPIDCIGATIPGFPLIVTGHNGYVGWGDTLSMLDANDFFIEKFKGDDVSSGEYLHKGEWKKATIVPERIKIKGGRVEDINVTQTVHGPIITDLLENTAKTHLPEDVQYHLSYSSVPLQLNVDVVRFLRHSVVAKNVHGLRESFRDLEAPGLAVVAGDVDGNIGYQMIGKSPIRQKGDGSVPVPGWTGEYDWGPMIPYDEMPHDINPEHDFVVACNHLPVPRETYPYELGHSFMNGERSLRISELLRQNKKFDIEEFKKIHMDVFSRFGYEFAKLATKFQSSNENVKLAQRYLLQWDGNVDVDSVPACIYEETRRQMIRLLLDPSVEKSLQDAYLGASLMAPSVGTEYQDFNTAGMLDLLRNDTSPWLRNLGGRDAVLEKSLAAAVESLTKKLGSDDKTWKWGKLHKAVAPHMFGKGSQLLDKIFSFKSFPSSGDGDTVHKMGFLQESDNYRAHGYAVSLRFLFDFADLSKAVGIITPGQSGRLGSKHYSDLGSVYAKDGYIPLHWTDADVSKARQHELVLRNKK